MWSLPVFVKIAVTAIVREAMERVIAPLMWVIEGKNVLKKEDATLLIEFLTDVRCLLSCIC